MSVSFIRIDDRMIHGQTCTRWAREYPCDGLGANQRRLVAKIAGGACMFEMSGLSSVGNVGARNAEEAKIILKELRIPLIAEDTGLNYGRTVELDCETGDFRIKSVGKEIKVI